jgi:hypothetical protein
VDAWFGGWYRGMEMKTNQFIVFRAIPSHSAPPPPMRPILSFKARHNGHTWYVRPNRRVMPLLGTTFLFGCIMRPSTGVDLR